VTTFTPGDNGEINGVVWRVVAGRKADGDMAVELRTAEWVRTKMALPLLLSDFHYQVEDILFPRALGQYGGEYFLHAVAQSCREHGWEQVSKRVELERWGGRYPVRGRYKPAPPWENREDQGRAVGKLRTAVTNAMWNGVAGADCAFVIQRIRDVIENRDAAQPDRGRWYG
jgi:hypothetical protein